MSFAAALSAAWLALTLGASPGEYTEKSLCDLWAGAQCHATSCQKDAKERCAEASARCRNTSARPVPKETAEKTAECAKATLQQACGAPPPAVCAEP